MIDCKPVLEQDQNSVYKKVQIFTEWYYFEIQGPIIVDQRFQEMTEVKFVFKNCFASIPSQGNDLIIEALEVTKMPFEESVSKIINCKLQ